MTQALKNDSEEPFHLEQQVINSFIATHSYPKYTRTVVKSTGLCHTEHFSGDRKLLNMHQQCGQGHKPLSYCTLLWQHITHTDTICTSSVVKVTGTSHTVQSCSNIYTLPMHSSQGHRHFTNYTLLC